MPATTISRPSAQGRKRPRRAGTSKPASQVARAGQGGGSTGGPDYAARVRRLRGQGERLGLSELLITNPNDVGYLTGFLGGDSYLLVRANGQTIISDFRYAEELEPLARRATIVMRTGGMMDALATLFKDLGCRRVGLQSEHMTLASHAALAKAARGVKLIGTSGIVAALRAIKDAHEVALIRRAIRIEEEAFEATLPVIERALRTRGSISELEIAAALEAEMKTRGSSKPGFETIVGAKANGSLPHYRPGHERHVRNRALLIDWGSVYRGYHGDQTRVLCWGKWPAKVREIYAIVRDAHLLAAAALAPGRTTREIDAIARDHITRHGFGPQFGHGLGHGIGLDGHEDPRVTHMMAPVELRPGMVVTIEPGIYLPGVGGVRIEDDFLITPTGYENLCSLPTTLEWATR